MESRYRLVNDLVGPGFSFFMSSDELKEAVLEFIKKQGVIVEGDVSFVVDGKLVDTIEVCAALSATVAGDGRPAMEILNELG